MKKIKISVKVAEDICKASKNVFPNEFISLVGSRGKNGIIDELVVVPAIFGEFHSIIYSHLIPFDSRIMGTVHSHPTESNYPSDSDFQSFRKLGKIHIIICRPFSLYDMRAFESNGRKMQIEIV